MENHEACPTQSDLPVLSLSEKELAMPFHPTHPTYSSNSRVRIDELEESLRRIDAKIDDMRRLLADKGVEKHRVKGNNKRKIKVSGGSSSKKMKQSDSQKIDQQTRDPYCNGCRTRHRGPCTKKTMRCRNCGQTGHPSFECKNEPLCYVCKEIGHISKTCPKAMNDSGKKIEASKA